VFASLFTAILSVVPIVVGFVLLGSGELGAIIGGAAALALGAAMIWGFVWARRTSAGWRVVKELPAGRKALVYLVASVGAIVAFALWYAWGVFKAILREVFK
jgi:hypothetical protein